MEDAIKWYRTKIHAYDLKDWEKNVLHREKHVSYSNHNLKEETLVKYEYVDVDMITGSAFSKNKAPKNSVIVIFSGCFHIIFFPFYFRWWVNQTNFIITFGFSILYIISLSSILIYLLSPSDQFQYVTFSEIFTPLLLMLITGTLHCQIACTKDTKFDDSLDSDDEYEDCRPYNKLEGAQILQECLPVVLKDDIIKVRVWNDEGICHKIPVSFVEIGSVIMRKAYSVEDKENYFFCKMILFFSTNFVPIIYRWVLFNDNHKLNPFDMAWLLYGAESLKVNLVVIATMTIRLIFTAALFVILTTADETFRKRFYFAKYFSCLTSCRRSMLFGLPHFRLNKVKTIKVWLLLRSYLQRRGPQRSTDIIFSTSCTCFMFLLCFITFQMIQDSSHFTQSIVFWECCVWLVALTFFLVGYILTGVKIRKKYKSASVLLTEQFNVYLQLEKKPEKKEKYQLINNVLTITIKLIKETDFNFSIFGLAKKPIFFGLIRIIVLSAFSGAIRELLGFKVKMWKIKH